MLKMSDVVKAEDLQKIIMDKEGTIISRVVPVSWPKVKTNWVLFHCGEYVEVGGYFVAYPVGATFDGTDGFFFTDTSDKYPLTIKYDQAQKIKRWMKAGLGFVLAIDEEEKARVMKYRIPKEYRVDKRLLADA